MSRWVTFSLDRSPLSLDLSQYLHQLVTYKQCRILVVVLTLDIEEKEYEKSLSPTSDGTTS